MRLIALLLAALGVLPAEEPPLAFPGRDWVKVKPESEGYSSQKLTALRAWLQTQQTTALHVSVKGRVIFEYGDVARVSKVASVRKSILGMLFGVYQDKFEPGRTVEELGLADVQPFLDIEKRATLIQLLTARSGVYLPTANKELSELMPRRGSQIPGTYFQYHNWDFNAAGAAFEKLTGKDIFVALDEDLAKPVGMQDFDRARQRKNDEMPITRHPEYAMYLSTRDTARLGLLMLADGRWASKQVMPKGWAKTLATMVTRPEELHPAGIGAFKSQIGRWGYGVLWWVWDSEDWPHTVTGPYQNAFSAMGANGQYITVLPVLNLVLAHKVDFDQDGGRHITPSEFHTILQMVIDSACSGRCN